RADFSLPYDARFSGQLDVGVFAMTAVQDRDRSLWGRTGVIYPGPQELQVGVHMAKTTFRPGEDATVGVQVKMPDGKPTEGALGVLVYDRAVAERVRTDEDFGRGYGFSIFDYYDAYRHGIGGISYRDLLYLSPTQPFSPDLDLTAGLIVRSTYWSAPMTMQGGMPDYAAEAATFFNVREWEVIKQ